MLGKIEVGQLVAVFEKGEVCMGLIEKIWLGSLRVVSTEVTASNRFDIQVSIIGGERPYALTEIEFEKDVVLGMILRHMDEEENL